MATTSEVKIALSDVAQLIKNAQVDIEKSETRLQNAYNILDAIPTTYSDEMSTIDGYTPTGAFETLAKDEKSKLTTEFQALKSTLSTLLSYF